MTLYKKDKLPFLRGTEKVKANSPVSTALL